MNKVLVVAPHPDDETLGCGGSLLKHQNNGDQIFWLIMTHTRNDESYSVEFTQSRNKEIEAVRKLYSFEAVHVLNNNPATLDQIPLGNIIRDVNNILEIIKPNIVYLPYRGDAHSDHKVTFDACIACTKSFRNPSIKSVRIYEVLSETDFGLNPDINGFRPNYFIGIEEYLEKKIDILNVFSSEMKKPPFPRNEEAVRALSLLRGQVAGVTAAEAFMSLKEIWID